MEREGTGLLGKEDRVTEVAGVFCHSMWFAKDNGHQKNYNSNKL